MKTAKSWICCWIILFTFTGLSYENENKIALNESKYNTDNLIYDSNFKRSKEFKKNFITEDNKQKKKELNITMNSFIQKNVSTSTYKTDLSEYNDFIRKFDEGLDNAKIGYITAVAYSISYYYLNSSKPTFFSRTNSVIQSFISCENESLRFHRTTKKDMRQKFYNLHLLKLDPAKKDQYPSELSKFKSELQSHLKKSSSDNSNCKSKGNAIFPSIENYMFNEFCTIFGCISGYDDGSGYMYDSNRRHTLVLDYLKGERGGSKPNSKELIEKMSDYLNTEKVKIVLNENIIDEKTKIDVKKLVEEITNIHDNFKRSVNLEHNFYEKFDNYYKNRRTENITKFNVGHVLTDALKQYTGFSNFKGWNGDLERSYNEANSNLEDIIKIAKDKLDEQINALEYPKDTLEEDGDIYSNSGEISRKAEGIIEQYFKDILSISYKYRNDEIDSKIRELTDLHAQALALHTTLKVKYEEVCAKHSYNERQKSQILELKQNLPRSEDEKLSDLTYEILASKQSIEDIIAGASQNIQELKDSYEGLKALVGQIEQLKLQVIEKNGNIQEIIRREDGSRQNVIDEIKRYLGEIKNKISNLRPIIDLKGTAKKDLEIIETFIVETSFNNMEYTQKKQKVDEKINLAIQKLFDNEQIEEPFNRISQFLTEKEPINYNDYTFENLNATLREATANSTEIDSVYGKATNIVSQQVTPATDEILKLKNDIITHSIKDLYQKMKNSFDTFKSTTSSLNQDMGEYEKEKDKLQNCEKDLTRRKSEFVDNNIEEDGNTIGENISCQDISNPENTTSNMKTRIETHISDNKRTLSTIKEQLKLYKNLEKYFTMSQDTATVADLRNLKGSIDTEDIDNKMNGYESKLTSTTDSIKIAIKNIELLRKIIESVKILNKILNEYNISNESINDLRRRAESLKDRINEEVTIINNENVIEQEVKSKFVSKLNKEIGSVENEIRNIDALEQKLNQIQTTSNDLKNKVSSSTSVENVQVHSNDILAQESSYKEVKDNINSIDLSIKLLITEVDNAIRLQNDEISNIVHDLITKLHEQIDNEAQTKLNVVEETEGKIDTYNFDNDIEKVKIESYKGNLRAISQNIVDLMGTVKLHKNKITQIREKSQNEFEKSNNRRKNMENLNNKKNDMKDIYENMKRILEELHREIQQLEPSLTSINKKKIEYKKELLYYTVSLVSEQKEKANEEIGIIDQTDKRIQQLKENTKDASDAELTNFNCESYVSAAKNCHEIINELVRDVNVLRDEANSAETESDIDSIQINVEGKLKDAIKEKGNIDSASNEIQDMEKMLMLKKFSIIMENMHLSLQKSKEEELIIKQEFAESEKIKNEIMDDFKKAEGLRDALKEKEDENSIDADIKEIRGINDNFATKIKNIDGFLTTCGNHDEACKLHCHNIERGKTKIEYLKNHDHDKEKKITQPVIDEIDGYVRDSKINCDEGSKSKTKTREIYDSCSVYKEKMNDLLSESLILGEKTKVEIKKKKMEKILTIIKDNYDNINTLIEKLEGKLESLKEQDVQIEERYKEEANNRKSIDAFGKIQIIKTNSSSHLEEVEILKQRVISILNDSESVFQSLSAENETDNTDFSIKLKVEQDKLKKALEILTKLESNKDLISVELDGLKEKETMINGMESEMEISKKSYEEGILEEVKKKADKEKENIESLISSINSIIDQTVTTLEQFKLEENNIAQGFEETRLQMSKIFDLFDTYYKKIEAFQLGISESSTKYSILREKRENAIVEKENLKNQKEEMEKLLETINNIKKKETLKLILLMKKKLDEMNAKAEEEYSKVKAHIEGMNAHVENIKGSDSASSAMIELNKVKSKDSEIKQFKTAYSSYKDQIDLIKSNIDKAASFIDMNIESISKLGEYESIKNIKDIVSNTQTNLDDIEKKVQESERILEKANNIYEEVKLREELKKRIREVIEKVENTFPTIESAHEKSEKIKKIKFDEEEYDAIFNIGNDYQSVRDLLDSYKIKLNEMDREQKINTIKSELGEKKSALNALEQRVQLSKDESARKTLEDVKDNIDTIEEEVDDRSRNILEIDRVLAELLELGKNYKLSLQSVVITSVHVEISKNLLIIQQKQKDVVSCVEYIQSSCGSITNDIHMLNESYSKETISNYESTNVHNANEFSDNYTKTEKEAVATSSAMQQLFTTINENKDFYKVDEYLKELKDIYEKFNKEKTSINEILRNLSSIKLKEMEKFSEKFLEIAKSHKTVIEGQKEKFIERRNTLKEIEDFLREKEQLLSNIDRKKLEYMKDVDDIYRDIINKVSSISELESANSAEYDKMTVHVEKISYLIEKIMYLLRDAELHKNEGDPDISEDKNKDIFIDVNYYIGKTIENGKESKYILENIKSNIEKDKNIFDEISGLFSSINSIMKSVNEMKDEYQRESSELDKKKTIRNPVDKTIKKEDESIATNEDIAKNSQNDEGIQELSESTGDQVSENIGYTESKNTDHTESENTDHTESENTDHTENENTDHTESENTGHTESENTSHNESENTSHNESENKGDSVSNEMGNIESEDSVHIASVNSSNHKNDESSKKNYKGRSNLGNTKSRLAGGILGGLLISSAVLFAALYKNKSDENDIVEDEECEEYDTGNDLFNTCNRDEAIEVTFEDFD